MFPTSESLTLVHLGRWTGLKIFHKWFIYKNLSFPLLSHFGKQRGQYNIKSVIFEDLVHIAKNIFQIELLPI